VRSPAWGEIIARSRSVSVAEATFATAARALGLGLQIASQIAQAHGGRLDVTSTPNETRFVLTMRLLQPVA
jgi:signal transduction histidine kinase